MTHDIAGTANDISYAWTFDRSNQITGYTRSDGGTQTESDTFGYDADSRPASRIDARGVRTTYVYDAVNRLTGRRYSDGTRVTLAYDTVGNRTSMADSSGSYQYRYDALSRRTMYRDLQVNRRLTTTYDAIGQQRSLTSTSGRFTYTFDAAGRSVGLSNPRVTWTYDAAGNTLLEAQRQLYPHQLRLRRRRPDHRDHPHPGIVGHRLPELQDAVR